jgi:cell fate regulator YaaT (PSP1 superfamily)
MMEEQDKDITKNPLFNRGCCSVPSGAKKVFKPGCAKLNTFDWLDKNKLPASGENQVFVEVRFKNNKKEFYRVSADLKLEPGDIVAVEGSPGHDIGIVSMTGELVKVQMKKKNIRQNIQPLKKVYRHARAMDIDKWIASVNLEEKTIFKTREIAGGLNLSMKINDVEYQGDGTKATFYYTADERVDFRELIKVLAETFRVRIEMRQIGARQEASRLGGIGSCGREICCSTWISSFCSVTTGNARTQQLSLNPAKLAGQCAKLKCCLNFENDMYLEALKEFPGRDIILKTKKGDAEYQKADVFKRIIWYSYLYDNSSMMAIPLDKVKSIIKLNLSGTIPENLEDYAVTLEQKTEYVNGMDQEELKMFDEEFK